MEGEGCRFELRLATTDRLMHPNLSDILLDNRIVDCGGLHQNIDIGATLLLVQLPTAQHRYRPDLQFEFEF
jgi:hypothetical protein